MCVQVHASEFTIVCVCLCEYVCRSEDNLLFLAPGFHLLSFWDYGGKPPNPTYVFGGPHSGCQVWMASTLTHPGSDNPPDYH